MGVTPGKAVRKETSALSLLFIMLQKVFAFFLLGSVAHTLPVAEPEAEADPQFPFVHAYGPSLLYHAPNCTTEEEVIQIKKCTPKTENECEDIEIPGQKLEYVLKCQNVTTTHCANGLITVNADEAVEKVKREAEAEADAEAEPHFYGVGLAPVLPLLKHSCVDTVQEHCIQDPKVTEITNTVKRCLVKTTVDCEDVEHKIPKTVCAPAPVTYIG